MRIVTNEIKWSGNNKRNKNTQNSKIQWKFQKTNMVKVMESHMVAIIANRYLSSFIAHFQVMRPVIDDTKGQEQKSNHWYFWQQLASNYLKKH